MTSNNWNELFIELGVQAGLAFKRINYQINPQTDKVCDPYHDKRTFIYMVIFIGNLYLEL